MQNNKATLFCNTKVPKNILWIVVDSVRSYSGAGDSRDFLPIFSQLADTGVRYLNVQTSAPSTIMSTSSMMSGVDSIYHSLTYQRFDSTNNGVSYLTTELQNKGYNVYFITFFPEGFSALPPIYGGLTSDLSSAAPPKTRFWTNSEINIVLQDLIKKKIIKEPFFFYLNYNCRHDPETSLEVEKGLRLIESNLGFDNTYLIINSDHGYPDPSKRLKQQMKILGHDIVMTEDNITVPLVIRGPLLTKKQMVNSRISLLDVSDFILSVADDRVTDSKLYRACSGSEEAKDIHFTWNRYPAQFGGLVSATYMPYKLVYSLDKESYEWYKINSFLDKSKDWVIAEETLGAHEIEDGVRSLMMEAVKSEIDKVVSHFSKQIAESLKSILSENNATTISLTCAPTNLYWRIMLEACKSLDMKAEKKSSPLPGFAHINIMHVHSSVNWNSECCLKVYIPKGVSPLILITDLYKLSMAGCFPSFITDYDLKLTLPTVRYSLKQSRAALRQLNKSVRGRGPLNTLAIVFNGMRRAL